MKRIVVLGGTGFFGSLIVEKLRNAGLSPIVASRSAGDVRLDANNADDLRAHLKQRDLVIDAAGPFQDRTPALIDAAARMGFDVVDMSDCAAYAAMVNERSAPIASAGIRVLTACGLFSTVAAAVLRLSSVTQPRRLTAYFRPPSRLSSNRGLFKSLLSSLNGRTRKVWLPEPIGARTGLAAKCADAVTLPPIYPTLRDTDLVLDAGIPGANFAVLQSLRQPVVRSFASKFNSAARALAGKLGPKSGVLAYEIVATGGPKYQYFAGENVHLGAVLPPVMAATAIAAGKFPHRGVVPPSQHVEPGALFDAMFGEGIAVVPPWGT